MLRGRHSVPRLGIALLVSLVVLGACGGGGGNKNKASEGGSTNGKKTAVLGFVGALTGDSANLGVNIRDGAKVAIDEWNGDAARGHPFRVGVTAGAVSGESETCVAPGSGSL